MAYAKWYLTMCDRASRSQWGLDTFVDNKKELLDKFYGNISEISPDMFKQFSDMTLVEVPTQPSEKFLVETYSNYLDDCERQLVKENYDLQSEFLSQLNYNELPEKSWILDRIHPLMEDDIPEWVMGPLNFRAKKTVTYINTSNDMTSNDERDDEEKHFDQEIRALHQRFRQSMLPSTQRDHTSLSF